MPSHLFASFGDHERLLDTVGVFYNSVMKDPSLGPFFENIDVVRQMKIIHLFLRHAFDAASNYDTRCLLTKMRSAHRRLIMEKGLNTEHFDLWMDYFQAAARSQGIDEATIESACTKYSKYRYMFSPDDLDREDEYTIRPESRELASPSSDIEQAGDVMCPMVECNSCPQ